MEKLLPGRNWTLGFIVGVSLRENPGGMPSGFFRLLGEFQSTPRYRLTGKKPDLLAAVGKVCTKNLFY